MFQVFATGVRGGLWAHELRRRNAARWEETLEDWGQTGTQTIRDRQLFRGRIGLGWDLPIGDHGRIVRRRGQDRGSGREFGEWVRPSAFWKAA